MATLTGLVERPERGVQVLRRVFAILDVLSQNGGDLALTEISQQVELTKSTVHRLLRELQRHGYVEQTTLHGKYRLGSRLIELGMSAVADRDLCETARPYLRRLMRETGETAHLGVLRDGLVMSAANVESPRTLRTPATVGRRTSVHCSSQGKALLAFLPEEEVDAIIALQGLKAFTRTTITSAARLKAELQEVRKRGYAVDNEEYEEGLKCIGAPVRDHSGSVVAAISIAGPAVRLNPGRFAELTRCVLRAAADISAALGYRKPPAAPAGADAKSRAKRPGEG